MKKEKENKEEGKKEIDRKKFNIRRKRNTS